MFPKDPQLDPQPNFRISGKKIGHWGCAGQWGSSPFSVSARCHSMVCSCHEGLPRHRPKRDRALRPAAALSEVVSQGKSSLLWSWLFQGWCQRDRTPASFKNILLLWQLIPIISGGREGRHKYKAWLCVILRPSQPFDQREKERKSVSEEEVQYCNNCNETVV